MATCQRAMASRSTVGAAKDLTKSCAMALGVTPKWTWRGDACICCIFRYRLRASGVDADGHAEQSEGRSHDKRVRMVRAGFRHSAAQIRGKYFIPAFCAAWRAYFWDATWVGGLPGRGREHLQLMDIRILDHDGLPGDDVVRTHYSNEIKFFSITPVIQCEFTGPSNLPAIDDAGHSAAAFPCPSARPADLVSGLKVKLQPSIWAAGEPIPSSCRIH